MYTNFKNVNLTDYKNVVAKHLGIIDDWMRMNESNLMQSVWTAGNWQMVPIKLMRKYINTCEFGIQFLWLIQANAKDAKSELSKLIVEFSNELLALQHPLTCLNPINRLRIAFNEWLGSSKPALCSNFIDGVAKNIGQVIKTSGYKWHS